MVRYDQLQKHLIRNDERMPSPFIQSGLFSLFEEHFWQKDAVQIASAAYVSGIGGSHRCLLKSPPCRAGLKQRLRKRKESKNSGFRAAPAITIALV